MPQNRDISSLEDNFERRFRAALDEYNRTYEPDVFVTEALRNTGQQKVYVTNGASGTMKSNHLIGKAVDIGFKGGSLYPVGDKEWLQLCAIMRKYGIVNGYYDLMWYKAKKPIVDKPHFQPVEIQKPVVPSLGYNEALQWKLRIGQEISKNSTRRNQSKDEKEKNTLHERNNLLRSLLQ